MKIPESISVLGKNLTEAAAAFGASTAVTYLARSVQVVAPHVTHSLVEGGVFGLIVNRVAHVADVLLPKQLTNHAIFGLPSKFGSAGGVAYALSHLAFRAGLTAAAITPHSAVALTVVTAVFTHFRPSDKAINDFFKGSNKPKKSTQEVVE